LLLSIAWHRFASGVEFFYKMGRSHIRFEGAAHCCGSAPAPWNSFSRLPGLNRKPP
jgi:hypothetical protein